MSRVYRIQDRAGRGPWRPGLSRLWSDPYLQPGMENLLPWGAEFGDDLLERRGLPGEHYGCAVRKLHDLARWLSPTECRRLQALGFNPVSIRPDRILAESTNQLVIACRAPLARAARIEAWDDIHRITGAAA
jgi:hypothetical protein